MRALLSRNDRRFSGIPVKQFFQVSSCAVEVLACGLEGREDRTRGILERHADKYNSKGRKMRCQWMMSLSIHHASTMFPSRDEKIECLPRLFTST